MKNGTAKWKPTRLGDVVSIQNGYAFDADLFHPSEGTPLIRIRDLKRGVTTTNRFRGSFDRTYLVNAGDMLIGMDGEFRCYKWQGAPALLNQRVCRLLGFSADVEPDFIFFQLNAHLKRIEDNTPFATVKHLSSRSVAQIELGLPSIAEQRRIAVLLSEATARLDEMAHERAAADSDASQIVLSALNAFWSRDEIADVPRVTLAEAGRIVTGNTPSRKVPEYFAAEGTPWITPGDMNVAKEIASAREYLSPRGAEEARPRILPANAIAVCCIGATIGKVAIVREPTGINQQINGIVFDKRIWPDFGYWVCRALYPEIIANAAQSTLPILNKSRFGELTIPVPPLEVQKRIAAQLDEVLTASITLRETTRDLAADESALRQAILREAFAGNL